MTRPLIVGSLLAALCMGVGSRSAGQATTSNPPRTPPATGRAQTAPDKTRIAIRHGLDRDASKVNRTPKDTTWAALLAVTHPDDVTTETAQQSRFRPFETTTWRIRGTLTSIILRADGDFFLTVTDAQGPSSGVVEVPDPSLCTASPLHALIQRTRELLDRKYHPTTTKQTVNDPITVVGVGFFGWENPGSSGFGNTSRLMPGIGVEFK